VTRGDVDASDNIASPDIRRAIRSALETFARAIV
jgi:hypothetical protein